MLASGWRSKPSPSNIRNVKKIYCPVHCVSRLIRLVFFLDEQGMTMGLEPHERRRSSTGGYDPHHDGISGSFEHVTGSMCSSSPGNVQPGTSSFGTERPSDLWLDPNTGGGYIHLSSESATVLSFGKRGTFTIELWCMPSEPDVPLVGKFNTNVRGEYKACINILLQALDYAANSSPYPPAGLYRRRSSLGLPSCKRDYSVGWPSSGWGLEPPWV